MRYLFFISSLYFISCMSSSTGNTNNNLDSNNSYAKDSVLKELQMRYDLVLVAGRENHAWGHTAGYKIIALNGNEWMGYDYYVNRGNTNDESHFENGNINPRVIEQNAAATAWKFIQAKDDDILKKSSSTDPCSHDKTKKCNINDGGDWHIMILKPTSVQELKYYEPEFFENCCPGNANRKLFIEAFQKIEEAVATGKGR